MSTASVTPSPLTSPLPRRPASGVLARSTMAVRTRYRRQTAALMIATTVVGLWLGLSAPEVSPVAPVDPPAALGVADPSTGAAADDMLDPTRTHRAGGADRRGQERLRRQHP